MPMRCLRMAVAVSMGLLVGAQGSLVGRSLLSTAGAQVQGAAPDSPTRRVPAGLLALFGFQGQGRRALGNQAADGLPIDLRVADPQAVVQSDDALDFVGKSLVHSAQPAARLSAAIKQSGALSLEVWLRPFRIDQTGPARIVTFSRNPNERNLTLGQDGDKFEVRLRTTKTSANGVPALVSKAKSVAAEWVHVVYTYDRAGLAKLYVNGQLNAELAVGGEPANWDEGFQLGLGNELTGDRPWLGRLRLVAIYNRDLSAGEVEQNFRAGARIAPPSQAELLAERQRANARLFERRVAPLLSKHCLECHDAVTKKGNLDLSRKAAALAGGEGRLVLAGLPAESLLWQKVESDEMPHDRPPLAADDKALLKQWIDGGAAWSLEFIDPAVYAQGEGARKTFVQRLTVPEYIETVRAALGVDIARQARELLPPDLRADGFSNTAYNLNVDLGHVEAYAKLAELISEKVDAAALAGKHTNSRELTDENVTKVVEPVGRRLLRGPLSKEEIARYCGISTTVAASGGNLEEAVRSIVEAMLQSPRFLYRIERQPQDGPPRPVEPFELASRLSYILWGGPPDDALLSAAEKGGLSRAEVESQARRMLQDPRAVERSKQFLFEWLNLNRLDHLRPDPKRFPNWDPQLAGDMRRETLAFFEEIVWKQNRPLHDLLNAKETFVTRRLARHYGLPLDNLPAGQADRGTLFRYDLSNVPGRGGLLTQGSILTVGGDNASMVARGLFIMHELLRGAVRDPPPGVDTTPVPSQPGLTQRMVSEQRIASTNCRGCHAKFEPLAFALERFDGLGAYQSADEHGNALRDDGSLLIPGQERPVAYRSAGELMDLLAQSDRVRESFTWKLAQFALGRPLRPEDAPHLTEIHRAAQSAGGTYAHVMAALVTSDLVLMTSTETKP